MILNRQFRLDDPITWGVLPARLHWSSRTTRWTLGASDIMFTNPYVNKVSYILSFPELSCLPDSAFSAFFRAGQVLETFRGRGIYQPAVDTAIEKLDQGQWVCSQILRPR
jgi:monolysocardiolipin acyltransferase